MKNKKPFKGQMILERVFDAPIELVWSVHTEAEHLRRWWGPEGFTMEVQQIEFRPGGKLHYSLENKEQGFKMWGLVEYEEIEPPTRLVFVSSFADDAAAIVRHPMSATWPKKIRNILTLDGQGTRTLLTLEAYPIEASEAEVQTYEGGFENVSAGFEEAFRKLDEYLADLEK